VRVDFADSVDNLSGYLVSLRVLTYEGVEVFCDGTGNCESRDAVLNTSAGFDSMTGIGSVGKQFIARLAAG
jgi:hypothetical protein